MKVIIAARRVSHSLRIFGHGIVQVYNIGYCEKKQGLTRTCEHAEREHHLRKQYPQAAAKRPASVFRQGLVLESEQAVTRSIMARVNALMIVCVVIAHAKAARTFHEPIQPVQPTSSGKTYLRSRYPCYTQGGAHFTQTDESLPLKDGFTSRVA